MKILQQLGMIFVVCIFGEFISAILPFPFPGSVISMIVLFALLVFKTIQPTQIQETADFFQKNMAFFFIPGSVGIIQNLPLLREIWLPFVFICVVSTIITFAVTAWTVQAVIFIQNAVSKKNGTSADVDQIEESL